MRYIIGIDLGTTNSCVSYVDTQDSKLSIQPLRIPQLISPGYVESRPTLPSFCYLSGSQEWPPNALLLPWKNEERHFVGFLAQTQGAKVPTRLVQSAKSWLCHSAANRKDKILPLEGDEGQKISPVEATAHYLNHIKEAWDYLFARGNADAEFEQQEVILTVPASFDEVARRLTAEAAKMAGYMHLTLLEEPQAAFYSWIALNEKSMQEKLKEGDIILVCDVGGGTTDFSLIQTQTDQDKLSFVRRAVGDHLLLGGDNMDATLAHFIENKLSENNERSEFQSTQWLQLKHQARTAKETLLDDAENNHESFTVLLQGTGSTVIKGSLSTQLQRNDVIQLLQNGFFGEYSWDEAIQLRKSAGFRTMGLPFEEEPSITKHLAHFLKCAQINRAPDYILFNGGALKPSIFREAIVQSLAKWYGSKTQILPSVSLDLAVARGAAYYGKVRRGLGVRIGGGSSRAYYLGVDIKSADGSLSPHALTILPLGSDEGSEYECEKIFSIRPNKPVAFHLYTSQVRLDDNKGDMIAIDLKELQSLPAIHTILRYGNKQTLDAVAAKLHVKMTALGTLELWLQSQKTNHRWTLEFQIRGADGQENGVNTLNAPRKDELFEETYLDPAKKYILQCFHSPSKNEKIMETLEELLDKPRRDWSLSVLRGLFEPILSVASQRKTHADLEARWWNMAGFFLRPGFGYPLDDFRIKELWKIILTDFKATKLSDSLIQRWICYRRIAGGLNKGQQTQLANEILNDLLPNKSTKIVLKAKQEIYSYTEKIRALASFEWLENAQKIRLGRAIIARIDDGGACHADYWSLGRLGARHLVYGSAGNVVSAEECKSWIQMLLKLQPNETLAHLFAQLARKTDHRELNLSPNIVERIIEMFSSSTHVERLQQLLAQSSTLTFSEQGQILGDNLPLGLVLEDSIYN